MRLRQIEHVVAITDRGSVSAASAALRRPPSTLAQSLVAIEQEFGFPLFVRSGTQLHPTAELQHLLPKWRTLLRSAQLAHASVATSRSGDAESILTIATDLATPAEIVIRLIARLRRADPGTRVRMVPLSGSASATLAEDSCDLVAIPWRHGTAAPAAPLQSLVLDTADPWAVSPPGEPLPPADPLSIADLRGHTVIAQPHSAVADLARPAGIHLLLVEHREAHLPLALAGLGVCLVGRDRASEARRHGCQVRRLDTGTPLDHVLVFAPDRLTPPAQLFIDLATEASRVAVRGAASLR